MNTSSAIAPHCELCAWIVANEAEIRSGGAEYQSVKVTEATEVVCYDWVASILVITLTGQTSHRFVDDDQGAGAATIIRRTRKVAGTEYRFSTSQFSKLCDQGKL